LSSLSYLLRACYNDDAKNIILKKSMKYLTPLEKYNKRHQKKLERYGVLVADQGRKPIRRAPAKRKEKDSGPR